MLQTLKETITLIQLPIIFTEGLRIITLIRTIITMVISITRIMTVHMEELITGTHTGGMPTFS